MTDTTEAVALRLRDFIQAAQENAHGRIPMGGNRVNRREPKALNADADHYAVVQLGAAATRA